MARQEDVRNEFEGAITEINSNKYPPPLDDFHQGFNDGTEAAIRCIRRYIAGDGLFQGDDIDG